MGHILELRAYICTRILSAYDRHEKRVNTSDVSYILDICHHATSGRSLPQKHNPHNCQDKPIKLVVQSLAKQQAGVSADVWQK